MSSLDSLPLDEQQPIYRPSRPPTAVYPNVREVAAWRDAEFPATASPARRLFRLNLDGGLFSPAVLQELLLPLAREIRNGSYGPVTLVVVTSDAATVSYLGWLAREHDLTFFIAPTADAPLDEARPVGALTRTDVQTLEMLKSAGGRMTSSGFAGLSGIEVNAAVNRLTKLASKGYVYRVSRARPEGDVFLDPRVSGESARSARPDALVVGAGSVGIEAEVDLPEELREAVVAAATAQGARPQDLLVQAWVEFVERNASRLDEESELVGDLLRRGDVDGLAEYVSADVDDRAERAARRAQT